VKSKMDSGGKDELLYIDNLVVLLCQVILSVSHVGIVLAISSVELMC
jgi:hypothetical protein